MWNTRFLWNAVSNIVLEQKELFFCLWLQWQKKLWHLLFLTSFSQNSVLLKKDLSRTVILRNILAATWNQWFIGKMNQRISCIIRVVEINKAGERELWRSHRAGFTQSRINLKTDQDVQDLVHWIWVSLTQTWQIFELPLPRPNHSHCEIFSLFTINIVSIVSWTFTVQKCTAPKPCTLNFLKSIKRIFWNTSHHLFCSYPF